MSHPTSPDVTSPAVRSCPSCRLRFPTSHALRRHESLDHRPARDGAWLTAQCIGTTADAPDAAQPPAQDERAPSPPTPPDAAVATASAPLVRAAMLGLAVLAVLTAVLGPLPTLALSVLVWGHWARWRYRPQLEALHRRGDDRREPAA